MRTVHSLCGFFYFFFFLGTGPPKNICMFFFVFFLRGEREVGEAKEGEGGRKVQGGGAGAQKKLPQKGKEREEHKETKKKLKKKKGKLEFLVTPTHKKMKRGILVWLPCNNALKTHPTLPTHPEMVSRTRKKGILGWLATKNTLKQNLRKERKRKLSVINPLKLIFQRKRKMSFLLIKD